MIICTRFRQTLGHLGLLLILISTLPAAAETVEAGPYVVEVTIQPNPPVVGENEIQLTVTHNGQPAPEVEIHLTHDMVGVSMNVTPPTLSAEGPGRFSGKLELSMPGLWRLDIHAKGPEGEGTGELQLAKAEAAVAAIDAPSKGGRYQVSLKTTPAPPTVGDVSVRLEVRSVEDLPVSGATVFVGADMPGMAMGLRPAAAQEVDPGVY